MRILVHDYAGHPFTIQLSRELARRGHEILHVYYGQNNTPKGHMTLREGDADTLRIECLLTAQPIRKYSFFRRWKQEVEYGRMAAGRIRSFAPEVVLSGNTPLDAQIQLYMAARRSGARFVFWLQDVIGIASYRILRDRIPVLGAAAGLYHLKLERWMLKHSDRVVLIAEDFRKSLESWGLDDRKLAVIPNWAPIDGISVQPRRNAWSAAQGLDDRFCFLYTGTLGLKHNPALLLELARHFAQDDRVRVVVISEGLGADWLEGKRKENGLENLMVMGYQPFDRMSEVLATGDVLLAILDQDAGEYSVPSKVLSYLCAGRALLLATPTENLASTIVTGCGAGSVVPPTDVAGFIAAADRFYRDPEERRACGENARAYAQREFDIGRVADRFEEVLAP